MSKVYKSCCFAMALQLLSGLTAMGQTASVLAPPLFVGIQAEQKADLTVRLQESLQTAKGQWFAGGAALSGMLKQESISNNMYRVAEKHWVAPESATINNIANIVQPIVCSLGSSYVTIAQRISWPNEILLSSAHAVVPMKPMKTGRMDDEVVESLRASLRTVIGNAVQSPDPSPNFPRLKVQISDYAPRTRLNEGQSYCLNLLLGEVLLAESIVTGDSVRYSGEFLRRLAGQATLPAKANVRLGVVWTPQDRKSTKDWNFPLNLVAKLYPTEGVFAADLPDLNAMNIRLTVGQQKLRLEGAESLQTYLAERARPFVDELPQVAHRYGAWAYLDKGRAWGLRMKDRLTAETPDGRITGHVVAYFGSEAKLVSPRGYPITEGAILYIRHGQNRVVKGVEFTFDDKRFPAPWPPDSAK